MDWVRVEVDGVPTFWSPRDGDLLAGLVFRVGHADEPLPRRGVTHLVEHLVLHGVGRAPDHTNGEVDATTTTFCTHGSGAEVTAFLGAVCRSLHDLPMDRLAVESQVLHTEAASRSAGPTPPMLVWRYGATGYGLSGYEEYGLDNHTPNELRRWAAQWFTRGNAVLWLLGGPPPAGLALDLPDGPRMAPPAASSALPRTPAYFTSRVNGVGLCSVVTRSTAATGYAHLLRRRLYQALRVEHGLSYSPSASYDPRDGTDAHIMAFADGLPTAHSQLVTGFVTVLDRLADEPLSVEETGEIATILRAPLRNSEAAASIAVAAALDELFGVEPQRIQDFEASVAALSRQDLQAVAAAARDSALLMLPAGQQPPSSRYAPAPTGSAGIVDGQVLLSAEESASSERPMASSTRLVIGPTGVSVVNGPTFLTVKYDECQLMLRWPDGARRLIGVDGFIVHIEPNLWTNGQILPDLLDANVHPSIVVTQPARPSEQIPHPAPSEQPARRRTLFKRR